VDPNDKGAATYIRRGGDGYSVIDANFGTEPGTTSCLDTGDGPLKMDGAAVLFHATHQVPTTIRALLEKNGPTTQDIGFCCIQAPNESWT